jgi:hypothetical protein
VTQTDRVIAAARSFRGVCQVDLLGPETVDGGPPITRLAARIQDAEAKGFAFEIIGWRKSTKVYRLIDAEQVPASAADPPVSPAAAGMPSPRGDLLSAGPERLFDAATVEPTSHYLDTAA